VLYGVDGIFTTVFSRFCVMTTEVRDTSRVKRNLESLGLGSLLDNTDSFSSLLDLLIKVIK
jgi:hypothetical protein